MLARTWESGCSSCIGGWECKLIQISGGHVGRSYLKPQCARCSPSNPALGIYLDKYSWACIGVFITIWFATVKNQKESKSLLRESVKRLLSGRHVVRSRLSCPGFKGQCRSSGNKRDAAGSAQSALDTHWKHTNAKQNYPLCMPVNRNARGMF